ncbi:uncharacterized protein [Phaseolus vulgaris]|uniref:uncharacterized protein n=1 Tax=Phaseolus vulgaris TaxID=3885 RepID=UPI0035CB68B1
MADKMPFGEGASINRPPLFCGVNYQFWKVRMKIFMHSTDKGIWETIEHGPFIPQAKEMRVSQCSSAKEMWDILEVTHEGTNDVKRARKHALIQEYELFRMQKGETICDVQKRFSHIVNRLMSLGKTFDKEELNIKILKCLDRTWQPKVTAISESKDLTSMTVASLFGKLREHELKMNRLVVQESKDKHRKGIALKACNHKQQQNSSGSDEDTMSLLSRKFSKFLKKSQASKRYGSKKPSDFNTNKYTCYGCDEQVHIKAECPNNAIKEKADFKKEKRGKANKAYVAW